MSDETTLKAILQLSQQTYDLVVEFGKKQAATDKKLDAHMHDESIDLRAIAAAHTDAFPHGPVVHGHEHRTWKLTEDERAAIWLSVKKKVAESAAWAVIVAVVIAGWYWLQGHVR